MPDDVAKAVSNLLGYLGFAVEFLQEGATKKADLFAVKDGEHFVIEVKTKEDDARRGEQMERAFDRGSLYEEVHPMGRRNRISGIVHQGVRQLTAHAESDPIRLLWLVVLGPRATVYESQIRATLFGSTRVYDLQETSWQRDCFFFYHSDFFRWHEDLDGAVIARARSGQLCVNPFSPRADRLRRSPLAVTFGAGVFDPILLEATGDACVVDSDIDRSDEGAVLRFVQRKYGRPMLMNIDMGHHEVWAGFKLDDELDR